MRLVLERLRDHEPDIECQIRWLVPAVSHGEHVILGALAACTEPTVADPHPGPADAIAANCDRQTTHPRPPHARPPHAQGLWSCELGERAFEACVRLRAVKIPPAVAELGARAFRGCYSLTHIELPDCLETIGDGCFAGCTGLEKIALPPGLGKIGERAFLGCTALVSIALPATVTVIGDEAFRGCSLLVELVVLATPSSPTPSASGAVATSTLAIGCRAFEGCASMVTLEVPPCRTTVEHDAFRGCSWKLYWEVHWLRWAIGAVQ